MELEFGEKRNTGVYWDDVALFCHPEDYQLGIFPMNREDVVEIDTPAELAAEDPAYLPLLGQEHDDEFCGK